MEEIKVRKAQVIDFFSLSKIIVDDRNKFDNPMFVKGEKPVYTTWFGLKPFIKFFIHLLHSRNQVFFLEVNKNIAGVSVINENLIDGFFINKEYRHKGFGKLLMGRTIDSILKNYATVRIGVRVDNNEAKNFYKKFGFKEKQDSLNGKTIELEL